MRKSYEKYILSSVLKGQLHEKPFTHCIIDNFLPKDLAQKLEEDFLNYDNAKWFCYNNEIEEKKSLSDWRSFPKDTYDCFYFLNSEVFVKSLEQLFSEKLLADYGLHGGGWHIHANGGKLNPHLDYETHPFLGYTRKLNLIIYLSQDWKSEYGGSFGLWESKGDNINNLSKKVEVKFNRAIIFDTTQNSWHGLAEKVSCPENVYRKSLAVFYLQEAKKFNKRKRALFAPTKDQINNIDVLNLIEKRSNFNQSTNCYIK